MKNRDAVALKTVFDDAREPILVRPKTLNLREAHS